MKRVDVINAILAKKEGRHTYLEIGVNHGKCFLKINANIRIAVDPFFSIKIKTFWNAYKLRPLRWINDYFFSITSDEFFDSEGKLLIRRKPMVIFIDGLHTYSQSLRDVTNSLNVIRDDGIIVMHDCNPPTEVSAYPAMSYEHVESLNLTGWRGVVWRCMEDNCSFKN